QVLSHSPDSSQAEEEVEQVPVVALEEHPEVPCVAVADTEHQLMVRRARHAPFLPLSPSATSLFSTPVNCSTPERLPRKEARSQKREAGIKVLWRLLLS